MCKLETDDMLHLWMGMEGAELHAGFHSRLHLVRLTFVLHVGMEPEGHAGK